MTGGGGEPIPLRRTRFSDQGGTVSPDTIPGLPIERIGANRAYVQEFPTAAAQSGRCPATAASIRSGGETAELPAGP